MLDPEMNQVNETPQSPRGIRGWLLVFCFHLLIWQPLNLALLAASTLGSLSIRGTPAAVLLLLRVGVAAFGIAAGLAVAGRRPAAVALAKASVALSAAIDVIVSTLPYFPSNRMPGDTPLYVAASLAYYGAWFLYLTRSRRVRNTYR